MRLVMFSRGGRNPRLGAVIGAWDHWQGILDLHASETAVPSDMRAFVDLAGGLSGATWDLAQDIVSRSGRTRKSQSPHMHRPEDVRIHAPIAPRLLRDFLAFRGHVARSRAAIGGAVPPEWDLTPAYYNGNHLNVLGPGDPVPMMHFELSEGARSRAVETRKLDYEAEVGFVLGVGGHRIEVKDAAACLFGVTVFNDFSARDIQMTAAKIGMGPAPGKDWANAIGPCIVTRDEFGELRDQRVTVRVNGKERLRAPYRELVYESPFVKPGERAVWTFPEMVEFLSRSQTIHVGEVWGSGTIPGGCELERGEEAHFLNAGDRVEIEIEGIGILPNEIVPAR